MTLTSRFCRPKTTRVAFGYVPHEQKYWLSSHGLNRHEVNKRWAAAVKFAVGWHTGACGRPFVVQDLPGNDDKVKIDVVYFLASKGILGPA